MKEKVVKCSNCGGKGHVFDAATLMFPPFWIFSLFEKNSPDGISRMMCSHCEGEGYIIIKQK